jgi:hypothetical protein
LAASAPGSPFVPASEDGKPKRPAIVTVRDRKTVQRQREQQQMAKLMQGHGL